MSGIQVISKQTHDTLSSAVQNSANIKMTSPSVVLVQEKLENVAEIKKDGSDLIVIMKDGQTIVLEDYFAQGLSQHNLVFQDGPKELVWTQFTDPQNFVEGVNYQNVDSINGFLDFHIAPLEATPWIYAAGVAGLVAGGIALMQKDSADRPFNISENTVASANSANHSVKLLAAAPTAHDSALQDSTLQNSLLDDSVKDDPAKDDLAQGQTTTETASAAPDASTSEATVENAVQNNVLQADAMLSTVSGVDHSAAIYNVLSQASTSHDTLDTTTATTATLPDGLDWAALFSGNSAADIQIADTTADTNTAYTASTSPAAEANTVDNFALANVSLFDLLSTAWAG